METADVLRDLTEEQLSHATVSCHFVQKYISQICMKYDLTRCTNNYSSKRVNLHKISSPMILHKDWFSIAHTNSMALILIVTARVTSGVGSCNYRSCDGNLVSCVFTWGDTLPWLQGIQPRVGHNPLINNKHKVNIDIYICDIWSSSQRFCWGLEPYWTSRLHHHPTPPRRMLGSA